MLVKTQDYLDVFARFKQKENIEAVERLLLAHVNLEPFERSQLGTSSPSSSCPSPSTHHAQARCAARAPRKQRPSSPA